MQLLYIILQIKNKNNLYQFFEPCLCKVCTMWEYLICVFIVYK